ncbi:MAG TPA: M12 family metallo-peptidase [Dokdonella sp.]|uniref:M12 family metallo-peptidase n=1 Tax=Dokdonella sp. TaxID=2291710 RepID=UPI002D7F7368|nr:M12 family metallo-peptidase [Dokdonella sp.]HET9031666.1 M12 family metallo-peptidase [Dokdonella sp.]
MRKEKPRNPQFVPTQQRAYGGTIQTVGRLYRCTALVHDDAAPEHRGAGGNVQLAMQQLMDETQQAMVNSASAQTGFPLAEVNLVHAQEISRNASQSMWSDLLYLRDENPPMALRDYWAADIAMLVRKTPDGGLCGLAYIPGYDAPQPAGFSPLAVGVAVHDCTFSPANFQHEFAHLLGANHNPANTLNTTELICSAFGHWANPQNAKKSGKRTIMSYKVNNPPLLCRGDCTQVFNYSNSEVDYMGDWTFQTGVVDTRENARVIAEVAPFARDWKLSAGRIFADGFE